MWTYFLTNIPSQLTERISDIVITGFQFRLIQQNQNIPIRAFVGIATGAGAIEPYLTAWRNDPIAGFF